MVESIDFGPYEIILSSLEDRVLKILDDEVDIQLPEPSTMVIDDLIQSHRITLGQEQYVYGTKEKLFALRLATLNDCFAADDVFRARYDLILTAGPIDASMSWEERASKARTQCMDELIVQRKGERLLFRIDELIKLLDERLRLLERVSFHLHNLNKLMDSARILRSMS